jgi:hypothetical protein
MNGICEPLIPYPAPFLLLVLELLNNKVIFYAVKCEN